MSEINFRLATKGDAELLARLFSQSAPQWAEVTVHPDKIIQHLFSSCNTAEVIIAETSFKDAVGYVLFCGKFYTYSGESQIYLQDIFVIPEERGNFVGQELMRQLAKEAVRRKCSRIEWFIDKPEIEGFYAKTGAKVVQNIDLKIVRLEGQVLDHFANGLHT